MFFKKRENAKCALENHEESTHHGVSVMVWYCAIWHSRSAEQYSKSAEWHSLVSKWHAALRSYIHAIPCSFMFSCHFLRSFDTQKDFFIIKLRHSDKSNTLVFKKSSPASLFSKSDQLKFS